MSLTTRFRTAVAAVITVALAASTVGPPFAPTPASASGEALPECTTFFFNQTEDFNWANPANWSTLTVPTSTDVVCVDDVAVSGADVQVGTLRGSGSVVVADGTFEVLQPSALEGFEVQGGDVLFDASMHVGSLDQSAGTVAGAGTLEVSGSFVWSGGTQAGPGATHVLAGATADFTAVDLLTWGSRELAGDGVVRVTNDSVIDFGSARARVLELHASGVSVDLVGADAHVFGGALDGAELTLPVGNQLTSEWSLANGSILTLDDSIVTGHVALDESSQLVIDGDADAEDPSVTQIDTVGSVTGAGLVTVTDAGALLADGPVTATSLRNAGVVGVRAPAMFHDVITNGELLVEEEGDLTAATIAVESDGRMRVGETATIHVPDGGSGVRMESGRLEIAGVIFGDVTQQGGDLDIEGAPSMRGDFTQTAGTLRAHSAPGDGFATFGVDGDVSVAGTLWLLADGVVQQERPVVIGQTVTGTFSDLVVGESCADLAYEADRVIVRSTACPLLTATPTSESHGLTTIGVSISEPLGEPYVLHYETIDGTAIAGDDYVAATGTVTIAPGETTAAIEIALVDNDTAESDESFGLSVTGANTAAVALASVDVIDDDDRAGLDFFYSFEPILFGRSSATGINAASVVGIIPGADADTNGEAWLYGINDGHRRRLDWVGGQSVTDINEAGTVLTSSRAGQPDGQPRNLQIPPGNVSSLDARSLADDGTAAGSVWFTTDSSSVDIRLARWAPDGTVTVLTTPATADAVYGNDINNHGVIVGTMLEMSGATVVSTNAFRYDDVNGLVPLPSLNGERTVATAINDAGDIVGLSGDHAVRWTPAGDIIDLGLGRANDINNSGLVVGTAPTNGEYDFAAVAWNESGRHLLSENVFGIEDSAWQLTSATKVNDLGGIAGQGSTQFGEMTFALRPFDCVICVESEFVEARVDDPSQWSTVLDSTIEGNPVRLRAELTNQINDIAEIDVTVLDTLTGEPVDEAVTLALGANGGRQTIEVDVDTEGMAWSNGTKAAPRQFEIVIRRAESTVVYERHVVTLTVNPRPLVLVHGLWSDASTWDAYPALVHAVHPDWLVVPVETMDTSSRQPNTIDQNAFEVDAAIAPIRQITNAWQVDIVGHSMGGLISRSYIQNLMPAPVSPVSGEAVPAVRRLVMLGTPNLGSPCADWSPTPATYELRPSVVNEFNARTTRRFGVEFSVAVGQHLPFTCLAATPGDDVVPEISARFGIEDAVDVSDMPHTSMTSSARLFEEFVLPRLNGTHIGTSTLRLAADESATADASMAELPPVQGLYFGESILGPGEATGVGLNVPASASSVGVVITARDAISAELVDPQGVVRATMPALGAAEASAYPGFRTLSAPAVAGRWILRVRNTGSEYEELSIGAGAPGAPIELALTAQQSHWSGRVVVNATLRATGIDRPSRIEASIASPAGDSVVELLDDGLNRDGVAGDGVYGAVVRDVPEGVVTATVQLILPGFMRAATASTTVAIPDTPPANSAPTATPATVTTERDVPVDLRLTGVDLDEDDLTVAIADQPQHGTVIATATGFRYTPEAGFVGVDSLTFTVSDGQHVSAPAMVTIVVAKTPVLITNDTVTTAAQHQTVRLAAKIRDPYTLDWVPGTMVRFELGGISWTATSSRSTTVVDPEPQLDLEPGTYTLTISTEPSEQFAGGRITMPFTVIANRAPQVHFEQHQGDEAGYPTWFGATVDDPDDTDDVIAVEWDLDGDGTVDQRTGAPVDGLIQTTHTYPATSSGPVAPVVTVIDRAGNRASSSLTIDLAPYAPLGSLRMIRADERSMSALGIDDSGRFVLGAAFVPGSGFPVRHRLEVVDVASGDSEIVSIDPSGSVLDAEIGLLSPDGRYVAFAARAEGAPYPQVYLRDRMTGTTQLVSARNGMAGSGHSRPVAISTDAGRVLFSTTATDLAGGCGAGCDSLVVWTRASGQLTLVSQVGGIAVDGENGDLSADGTHVAVQLPAAGQPYDQIFVRNLATGDVALASATPAGRPGNGPSSWPRLDGTGSRVVFQTEADDLVADDGNNRTDVAIRDVTGGSTRLLAPLAGSAGNVDISTDGTTVVVNLDREPATAELHGMQVYAIDVATGSYRLLSRGTRTGLPGAAESVLADAPGLLSANGKCVVFSSLADDLVPGDVFDIDGTVTNGLGRSYDAFLDTAASCVPPQNHLPVAAGATVVGDEDSSVAVPLSADDADGDALTYTVVQGPAHGTLSGTAPALTYTPEANWHGTDTFTFTASDFNGVSAPATTTITVRPVNDLPTVSIVTPTPGTRVPVGTVLALDTTTADLADGNGPVTCRVTWGDGSSGSSCDDTHAYSTTGTFTISVTAADADGGRAVAATSVVVESVVAECRFEGFFQPVDNAPTVNTVKAGSNIPVKFRYCTDGRLGIFASASPSSSAHACGTASVDAIEETVQPGSSTLTYDPLSGRYHYNWKTDKAWKGQCRTLTLVFTDGTRVTAEFKFS